MPIVGVPESVAAVELVDTDRVVVRYTGSRHMPMRVDIYVNGMTMTGQGYRFGKAQGRDTAIMTRAEADVLTGATKPLVTPGDLKPINAVLIDGHLAEDDLSGEAWELVEEK